MVRHWIKIMLVSLFVLIETACPRYFTQQPNDVRVHQPGDHGGSDSDSG